MKLSRDNYDCVLIHGDHHGQNRLILRNVQEFLNNLEVYPTNTLVIHVGDSAIGFGGIDSELTRQLCATMSHDWEMMGVEYISIRGNHDMKYMFSHHDPIWYKNFKLIPDYFITTINGHRFQFVGGGTSVDRTFRTTGFDYDNNEQFELNLKRCGKDIEYLITHIPPSFMFDSNYEQLSRFTKVDKTLIDDLEKERAMVDNMVNKIKPKMIFCGHWHKRRYREGDGVKCNCLADINSMEDSIYKLEL